MIRRAGMAALLLAVVPAALPAQQAGSGLRAVLANGYRFAYVLAGEGRPVILVHGELTDYRRWKSLLENPPDSLQLIAYSRRYHAPNPWRTGDPPYGFEASAADLAALIRALHLDRPLVVGEGWGGAIALQAALRFPTLIGGLVLAEPVADSLVEDVTTRARISAGVRAAYAAALATDPERSPATALRKYLDARFGPEWWGRLPEADQQVLLDNARTLPSSAASEPPLSCAGLGQMQLPVMLLQGDSAGTRVVATMEGLARCIPAAARETIPVPLDPARPFPAAVGQPLGRFAATLPR